MRQIILYTGAGVSMTPEYTPGRSVSDYVRLIADDGKGITNGELVLTCADIKTDTVSDWTDCDAPPIEPYDELADAKEALAVLGVT